MEYVDVKLVVGDNFEYNNMQWICLDIIDGNYLAMTTYIYKELPFDVGGCNSWTESSLRKVLNTEFLGKLDKKHLVKYTPGLVADNGETQYTENAEPDYVSVLSCDQYRKYRDNVPLFDASMWTLTPWEIALYAHSVRVVHSSGAISNRGAALRHGVAPVCIFSSRHLRIARKLSLSE